MAGQAEPFSPRASLDEARDRLTTSFSLDFLELVLFLGPGLCRVAAQPVVAGFQMWIRIREKLAFFIIDKFLREQFPCVW